MQRTWATSATTSGSDTTSCLEGFLQKSRACLEYASKVSFLVSLFLGESFNTASEPYPGTGLYTAIFVMYLQYQTSKKSVIDNIQNVLFFLICILYILSVVTIAGDTVDFIVTVSP